MTVSVEQLVSFATDIALEAGRATLTHFRSASLDVEHKADHSPVTVADREAELILRQRIRETFPEDGIVGEEHDSVEGTSGRVWYLDPIDGTKSFVHGVPLYTNLVACEDPEGQLVGLINTPALDEITVAGRELGCFQNGVSVNVSTTLSLSDAYIMTSGIEWWPEHLRAKVAQWPATLRTWGDGYGYSLVASGRVEGMIDPEAEVWDLAPIPLIITEAGGTFTGVDGSPGRSSGSAVATNGAVHAELLAFLQS